MLAIKPIIEGLGLSFLLYLVCAIGIRNGAVGMIHLYEQKVQNRVIQPGMTTKEEIKKVKPSLQGTVYSGVYALRAGFSLLGQRILGRPY